jgi:hypothetical protein
MFRSLKKEDANSSFLLPLWWERLSAAMKAHGKNGIRG